MVMRALVMMMLVMVMAVMMIIIGRADQAAEEPQIVTICPDEHPLSPWQNHLRHDVVGDENLAHDDNYFQHNIFWGK